MNDAAKLSKLNLLTACIMQASKLATELREELQPVSTGRNKKKDWLSEDEKVRLLARKHKRLHKGQLTNTL